MARKMCISVDNLPYCGQQIIYRLHTNRKNQKWLAEQCKTSPTTITYIILGKRNPSLSLARRICQALSCSLDDIFEV